MSSFSLINEYQILGIAVVVLLFAVLSVLVTIRRDCERADTAPYNTRSIGSDESGLTNLCMLYDEKRGYYFRRRISSETVRDVYF